MNLKPTLFILFFVFGISSIFSQGLKDKRIQTLQNQLEILSVNTKGLSEKLNTDIALNDITLSNFLLAISNIHKVNINVDTALNQIIVNNSFADVLVSNVLLFLCKEYDLEIDFTANILSIRPFVEAEITPEIYSIDIAYEPETERVNIDVKDNFLYDVFRIITDVSAKNLVFAPGMETLKVSAYIQDTNFESAMDKFALVNNLKLTKTKDNFYVFDKIENQSSSSNTILNRRINSNFKFEIKDKQKQILEVDFYDIPIVDIIDVIGDSLAINRFTATPLKEAGNITFRSKTIGFDDMLTKIFEQQGEFVSESNTQSSTSGSPNNSSNLRAIKTDSSKDKFTFKKDNDIYFFGTEKQLSVRKVEIISLRNRSVTLMPDQQSNIEGSVVQDNFIRSGNNFRNTSALGFNNNQNRPQERNFQNQNGGQVTNTEEGDILDLIPKEVKQGLDFKVDPELNSIYVTGTSVKIEFFKDFIRSIDKKIPVIIIEVMIVEASRTNTVETGVEWGIGDNPVETKGGIFPTTDFKLGANTINKVINGFNTASVFNFGRVVPNFFATIKAMETNGDLKIKSTPKLATLNGHRASFSNGQTSYYAITDRNTFGTDNPITNEIRNYFPIDAKLGLDIKPYVTGSGEVILDIKVVQSSFGTRIAEDAPPDINSRNFSSIVSMKDQDIAVLGGLEENYKNNSGSGVPFLARIPIIKWLFSKRVREGRKSKLTVFIKPTVIR